jgi:hypothetical protein
LQHGGDVIATFAQQFDIILVVPPLAQIGCRSIDGDQPQARSDPPDDFRQPHAIAGAKFVAEIDRHAHVGAAGMRREGEGLLGRFNILVSVDATPDSPDYLEPKSAKGKGQSGHLPKMVAYTDKLIGKLIAKLDELKLRDDTLVLILGDNGTGRGVPSRSQGREVQGGKGTTSAWGTHVPLIGSWPGHFANGKNCPDPIGPTDFLPTLCKAASVSIPADVKIDGRSFLPQLRGEKGNPREWLYGWYNSQR